MCDAKGLTRDLSNEETDNLVIADDVKCDKAVIEAMESVRNDLDDIESELDYLADRLVALRKQEETE